MSLDFWLVGLGFCGFGDVSFWANALFWDAEMCV